MALDESLHGWYAQVFGHTIGEACDYSAQVADFIYPLLDEARELMDVLG